MKKRSLMKIAAVFLAAIMLVGCAGKQPENKQEDVQQENQDGSLDDAQQSAQDGVQTEPEMARVRVGSMKGPTSMGLVHMMSLNEQGQTGNYYEFTMEATADMLLPSVIAGDLDIVLVPANVASVLYQKTEGGVCVIDINTLGVLYMVSADDTITDMQDLKGRTIYLTGKGTTPDFVLQYLLAQNGIDLSEVTLEYKSEATEVAAVLTENPDAIGLLPQPYVTALGIQNADIQPVLDMTAQWDALHGNDGSMLVTGVTVVRKAFLESNRDAVLTFMKEHEESANYTNEQTEDAAGLVEQYGIVEKAAVAQKAIPYCNITYIDGEEMMNALSGYLSVLADQDASFIGGALPDQDFYYIP